MNSSVEKLRGIIQGRFGKNLQVHTICDSSINEYNDMQIKGVDLHIPLMAEEQLLGTAVLQKATDLKEDDIKTIAQMTKMILEPVLYNTYLERKEFNLKNTILFKENHPSEQIIELEIPKNLESDFNQLTKPELLTHLCHLVGHNELILKKASIQIHETAQRWAYAPWSSFKGQIGNINELKQLGAMTFYIEDIHSLNETEQDLIVNYLAEDLKSDDPLFIVMSPNEDTFEHSFLRSELKDELHINMLKLDPNKLNIVHLEEVIELFYFR